MLLFLLRNSRFRAHALVVILVVIGTVPENANGSDGKCYQCMGKDDAGCSPANRKETECKGSAGYCREIKGWGSDAKTCATSVEEAECHVEVFGEGTCADYHKGDEKSKKFQKCVADKVKKEVSQLYGSGVSPASIPTCICKGDLCNEAGGIKPTFLLITIVSALCIFLL